MLLFSSFVDIWQTFILSYLEHAKLVCKKVFLNEIKCIWKNRWMRMRMKKKNLYKDGFRLCYIKYIIGKKLVLKIYQNMNYLPTLWFEFDLFHTSSIFRRMIS